MTRRIWLWGIDSLRSLLPGPLGPTQALFKNAPGVFVRAAHSLRSWPVQLAAPVVDPRSGLLTPLVECDMRKKSPHFHASSSSNDGGEGGIRTPDTLPYTHFPGVLLQPLGHLTTLYRCQPVLGATGRYYRELY